MNDRLIMTCRDLTWMHHACRERGVDRYSRTLYTSFRDLGYRKKACVVGLSFLIGLIHHYELFKVIFSHATMKFSGKTLCNHPIKF